MSGRAAAAVIVMVTLGTMSTGCRSVSDAPPTPVTARETSSSAARGSETEHEFVELVMASPARLVLVSEHEETARRAARAAFDRMHDLEAIMSDWSESSELARFERLPRSRWHAVSRDLHAALAAAVRLARETGGAFDPTVGALVRAWRPVLRADDARDAPPADELRAAADSVDFRRLHVDPVAPRARLDGEDTRLDLGGIGKGIASDDAAAVLRSHGIDSFLIDFGGDLLLGDAPPGRPGWMITRVDEARLVDSNVGIATSGDRHQFVEIDGRRYAHLIDPRTGMPLMSRTEVTVRARSATEADALASAIAVLAATDDDDAIVALIGADGARGAIVERIDGEGASATERFGCLR